MALILLPQPHNLPGHAGGLARHLCAAERSDELHGSQDPISGSVERVRCLGMEFILRGDSSTGSWGFSTVSTLGGFFDRVSSWKMPHERIVEEFPRGERKDGDEPVFAMTGRTVCYAAANSARVPGNGRVTKYRTCG